MKANISSDDFLIDLVPSASQGTLDGKYRLACSVLTQAIKDLHDRRYPIRACEALYWLSCGEGELWADCLGYYVPDHQLLVKAARAEV